MRRGKRPSDSGVCADSAARRRKGGTCAPRAAPTTCAEGVYDVRINMRVRCSALSPVPHRSARRLSEQRKPMSEAFPFCRERRQVREARELLQRRQQLRCLRLWLARAAAASARSEIVSLFREKQNRRRLLSVLRQWNSVRRRLEGEREVVQLFEQRREGRLKFSVWTSWKTGWQRRRLLRASCEVFAWACSKSLLCKGWSVLLLARSLHVKEREAAQRCLALQQREAFAAWKEALLAVRLVRTLAAS